MAHWINEEGTTRCAVCPGKVFNAESTKILHLEGKPHRRALTRMHAEEDVNRCSMCGTGVFCSASDKKAHVNGRKHRSNLRKPRGKKASRGASTNKHPHVARGTATAHGKRAATKKDTWDLFNRNIEQFLEPKGNCGVFSDLDPESSEAELKEVLPVIDVPAELAKQPGGFIFKLNLCNNDTLYKAFKDDLRRSRDAAAMKTSSSSRKTPARTKFINREVRKLGLVKHLTSENIKLELFHVHVRGSVAVSADLPLALERGGVLELSFRLTLNPGQEYGLVKDYICFHFGGYNIGVPLTIRGISTEIYEELKPEAPYSGKKKRRNR